MENLHGEEKIDVYIEKTTFRPMSDAKLVISQILSDLAHEALIMHLPAYKDICADEFLISFAIMIGWQWQCTAHALIWL